MTVSSVTCQLSAVSPVSSTICNQCHSVACQLCPIVSPASSLIAAPGTSLIAAPGTSLIVAPVRRLVVSPVTSVTCQQFRHGTCQQPHSAPVSTVIPTSSLILADLKSDMVLSLSYWSMPPWRARQGYECRIRSFIRSSACSCLSTNTSTLPPSWYTPNNSSSLKNLSSSSITTYK